MGKKSNVEKKLEDILSKAPLLDSLTKKIEMVSNTANPKDNMKNQLNDIINILDDEIEITKENIVNPGPKERPMAKVLNTFLSQVEKLEKSIDGSEFSKNLEIEVIVKENKRKDEIIKDLTTELICKKTEIVNLGKELNDKNDDIESILLNSVSKETFIRSQFQNLTSEVRKLKQEKADTDSLQEKMRELEVKLRKSSHQTEDMKAKYDSSQCDLKKREKDIKDLEEMSTKMIGDITKGIGEKLAVAKNKEQELKLSLEKNATLESDLDELGQRFKQLNDDLIKIKAEGEASTENLSAKCTDLSAKCAELLKSVKRKDEEVFILRSENDTLILKVEAQTEAIQSKDEENVKLKEQVNNLTSRFRSKVKEIQETLSNYDETLKSKNKEIADQAEEIFGLKEEKNSQDKLIEKLKVDNEKYVKEVTDLKLSEETMKEHCSEQTGSRLKKRKPSMDFEVLPNKRFMLHNNTEQLTILSTRDKVSGPSSLSLERIFLSPISLQVSSPVLSLTYNWPIVPWKPPTRTQGMLSRNVTAIEVIVDSDCQGHGSKRKISSHNVSRKKFRVSMANRPVNNMN